MTPSFPRTGVSGHAGMLLYGVKGLAGVCCGQSAEDLSAEVALDRSDDLLRRAAFGSAASDVGAGGGVGPHSHDDGCGQGPVQASVTAAVEAVAGGVA